MRGVRFLTGIALVVAASVGASAAALSAGPVRVAKASGFALERTVDGLRFDNAFDATLPTRDILDDYTLNGSAHPSIGYVKVTHSGLVVGVQAHTDGFQGWFAVTNWAFPSSGVYHVEMSKPQGNVDGHGNQGEAVFAVQTGTTKVNGLINYVVVASNSRNGHASWLIGYSHGHLRNATYEGFQETAPSAAAPDTRDITLQTDGHHTLAVYFGSQLAYQSDRLAMHIPGPYQPYLEVQASNIAYQSRFQRFWVTASDIIDVEGMPAGQPVTLATPSGRVLAISVARGAEAHLPVPLPDSHGTGVLYFRSSGRLVRLGPFAYSGGDRYQLVRTS